MSLRIALQMDHFRTLNPRGDSSLLLGREAQKRGHELFFYTPDALTLNQSRLSARGHAITLREGEDFYTLGDPQKLDLETMDVVLLRQDPPFDMAYITSTYLLENLPPSVRVVNNPASVRNHPEKLLPLLWPEFMPPTLITADLAEIEAFRAVHKDIIVKPLYGHGGRAVLRFKADDDNLASIMEMHRTASPEPLMAQRFLPEVKTADRRIILLDGEVAGIMGRIPAEHEIRANFRVGGSPAQAELTAKQRHICETLKPTLKEKGLFFVGLDVIGDWLTEINVTSPTGMVQMNALYGINLEKQFWDKIEQKLA